MCLCEKKFMNLKSIMSKIKNFIIDFAKHESIYCYKNKLNDLSKMIFRISFSSIFFDRFSFFRRFDCHFLFILQCFINKRTFDIIVFFINRISIICICMFVRDFFDHTRIDIFIFFFSIFF